MKYYNPPHEVRNQEKLQSMINTLGNDGDLPPIVVLGEDAITGSHRLAAWAACDMEAETIEIEDEDYVAAMNYLGLDPVYDSPMDMNQLCAALYQVIDDEDVQTALADQID